MKNFIKSSAIDALSIVNAFPTSLTDSKSIKSLVNGLFPIICSKELIRLGPKGDGGYLVPDDLAGIEACFSPGVNLVSGFEKDCADLGMKVFLADRSVDQPAELHDHFQFTKKFVGVTTNEDFMTVDDWVESSMPGSQSDLLLQIDIEGYEYETFLAMSDRLMGRYRVIVAEFHYLDQLWNLPFFRIASRVFEKILQTHKCVHIHPNNCHGLLTKGGMSIPPVAEFTFLRNDRISSPRFSNTFPHPLDFDNTSNPHIILPADWYRK